MVGRWDRVDQEGDEVVIIDYKSSDLRDQAAADRSAKASFQMLVYALAWRTLHGTLPTRVELRFLEAELTGRVQFTEQDMDRGRALVQQVAHGVQAGKFHPEPAERTCRWCAFQAVCPHAVQTR